MLKSANKLALADRALNVSWSSLNGPLFLLTFIRFTADSNSPRNLAIFRAFFLNASCNICFFALFPCVLNSSSKEMFVSNTNRSASRVKDSMIRRVRPSMTTPMSGGAWTRGLAGGSLESLSKRRRADCAEAWPEANPLLFSSQEVRCAEDPPHLLWSGSPSLTSLDWLFDGAEAWLVPVLPEVTPNKVLRSLVGVGSSPASDSEDSPERRESCIFNWAARPEAGARSFKPEGLIKAKTD